LASSGSAFCDDISVYFTVISIQHAHASSSKQTVSHSAALSVSHARVRKLNIDTSRDKSDIRSASLLEQSQLCLMDYGLLRLIMQDAQVPLITRHSLESCSNYMIVIITGFSL